MSTKPSYWQSFLFHPANQALVMGGTAMGVLASLPYGWSALGLTGLGILALQVIGLAIVPSLPSFRKTVDDRLRRSAREQRRKRLIEEIKAQGGSPYANTYNQMNERVQALYRTASDAHSSLSTREVEQLDDLVVSYLAMCLSDTAMKPQEGNDVASVATRKLQGLNQALQKNGLHEAEQEQLKRAKLEYEEVLARQARMSSRRSLLEASLLSMPVRVEEVYQMVVASPGAGDLGALLEESVAKLRAAEEVSLDVDAVFRMNATPSLPVARAPAESASRAQRAVETTATQRRQ